MTTLPISQPRPAQGFDWRIVLNKLGPIIGLVFVFVLFTILVRLITGRNRFATLDNLELMLRLTAVVGIAAIGMTLIIISGGIDLSVGPVIALTTVIIALLLQQGYSATTSAIGGVIAAAICGLITSQIITRIKLPPFIATLGMWAAVRGAAKGFANNSTVYPPSTWHSTWLDGLLQTVPSEKWWVLVPAGVWLMLILATIIAVMLRFTRVGRHIVAVGSNEQTARLC